MATYSRVLLSGSVSGKPIKIGATATPGTLIHTAVALATSYDEVYVFVTNTSNAAVLLTIEFGGTTDPDNLIVKQVSIPPNSAPIPIVTGQCVSGGVVVGAFASVANMLLVTGWVNRIV